MNVLIAGGGTGGHLMPALAIATELRALRPDIDPILIGARRGIEATILPGKPFRHYLLPVEPLYRRQWWRNVRWPIIAWRLVRECHRVLTTEKPVLAVGTGGYAAAPILLASHWRGVPIALQEQNARPGLATRMLSKRARQIHLGFPEARAHLTLGLKTSVFEHGNPIVPPPGVRPDRATARARLGLPENSRVVLVVGGSQGARGINQAVAQALDAGSLDDVVLLWSTGQAHWEPHRLYDRPPLRQVRPFWDPIAEAYAASDLVVCRAGAMTLAELCAWGLPSVLVPLPTAADDHQAANARALETAGAARHLPESRLTAATLTDAVRSLLASPDSLARMGAEAGRRGLPDATSRIVSDILTLIG